MSTFQVPPSKASIGQNRFEFELPIETDDHEAAAAAAPEIFAEFEKARERWEEHLSQFQTTTLTKISIPKLQFIKPQLMKQFTGKDAEMLVLGLVDAYHPGVTDQLEGLDQLLALYEAWATASGLKVGESSGSSGSSTSTEEPSTETSSSSADPSAPAKTTEISAPSD